MLKGKCYELAYKLVQKLPEALLVHGKVMGKAKIKGKIHGHAWVELDGIAIDPAYDLIMPVKEYYALGKVRDETKYNTRDIIKNSLKFKHYGPWNEKEIR